MPSILTPEQLAKLNRLNANRDITKKRYVYRTMFCQLCQSKFIAKIDTKPQTDGIGYRIRWECENGHRWTTRSTILYEVEKVVIKKDGRKEPYSQEKYVNSLKAASKKRPISADRYERLGKDLTWAIEQRAASKIYEITSADIYKWALNSLKELDKISYLRYLSVGSRFNFLTDFKLAIHELEN